MTNNNMEENIREDIESHFCETLCRQTETAIKFKFPNIKDLDVSMDEDGMVNIIFLETEYTQEQVQSYMDELRQKSIKIKNHGKIQS